MGTFYNKIKESKFVKAHLPKAGSLLAAVALWAYIANGQISEVEFRIPITIKDLPSSTVVAEQSHRFVIVRLEGKSDSLKNVQIKDIQAVANLKGARPGAKKRYPLKLVKSNVPENVTISLGMSHIYVRLENLVTRTIRVLPQILGEPEKGYFAGQVSINPEFTVVEGPQSEMQGLNVLKTVELDITGKDGTVIEELEILKQYSLKGINVSDSVFTVTVPINKYEGNYEFSIPVSFRNPGRYLEYRIKPQSVRVTLRTVQELDVAVADFEVFVDLSALKQSGPAKKLEQELDVAVLCKKPLRKDDWLFSKPERVKITAVPK